MILKNRANFSIDYGLENDMINKFYVSSYILLFIQYTKINLNN